MPSVLRRLGVLQFRGSQLSPFASRARRESCDTEPAAPAALFAQAPENFPRTTSLYEDAAHFVSDLIIFDTSIFIDQLRAARHQKRIDSVSGLVRTSSVVLAELWRGATKPAEREFLETLANNHPILTPTERNWVESGQILSKLGSKHGLMAAKLRDLHFDTLIALTARSHGARLITSDRGAFELIQAQRKFELEIW